MLGVHLGQGHEGPTVAWPGLQLWQFAHRCVPGEDRSVRHFPGPRAQQGQRNAGITQRTFPQDGGIHTQLDETAKGILGLVKAGRFGDASEIAKAVVYLASDETRFAVGSELVVDGGLSL